MLVKETTNALSEGVKEHCEDQKSSETNTSHLIEAVGNTLTYQPWRGIRRHTIVPNIAEHDSEDASFNTNLTMSIQQVSERHNVDIDDTEDDKAVDQ